MAAYSELSVLIVDDDEDDTFLTSRMLEAVGFNRPFVTADSVARATALLAGGAEFGVVFVDIRMPEADGFELLRWIRNQPCFDELKVIMLTSSDDPIDVGRARQLRANGYLLTGSCILSTRIQSHYKGMNGTLTYLPRTAQRPDTIVGAQYWAFTADFRQPSIAIVVSGFAALDTGRRTPR